MKTADSENPNRGVAWPRNRAHGAIGQNQSRAIKRAEKQEKLQPKEVCFFLTSPFIELFGSIRCPCGARAIPDAEFRFLVHRTMTSAKPR